uniref:F-box domain-containing protein n=1 Tax=Oryza punctata TaxID=4537 RepID=A0A0E0JK27_ORYPU
MVKRRMVEEVVTADNEKVKVVEGKEHHVTTSQHTRSSKKIRIRPPERRKEPASWRRMNPPAADSELTDDLVDEILAPDDPVCLARASVVCKGWRHLLSDRAFLRLCRHRVPPPLLGFLHNLDDTDHPDCFIPTTALPISPPPLKLDFWMALYCRHGRALLDAYPSRIDLVVCGGSPALTSRTCSTITPWCDHLDCHEGPFLVVLVGTGEDKRGVGDRVPQLLRPDRSLNRRGPRFNDSLCRFSDRFLSGFLKKPNWTGGGSGSGFFRSDLRSGPNNCAVYSSESNKWSPTTSARLVEDPEFCVKGKPATLIRDSLYFAVVLGDGIVKYDINAIVFP